MAPQVLIVVTSFNYISDAERPTGWYLPELSHPYDVLLSKGVEFTMASPQGGFAPIDPISIETTTQDASAVSFLQDKKPMYSNTHRISEFLGKSSKFDALLYPGGAGPMFDLATDAESQALISEFAVAGKPIGLICHAPVALQGVKMPDKKYLVDGKTVTGLSDVEEEYYGLIKYVPFSLENRLRERGAAYVKATDTHGENVVVDGVLITGQNVASARGVGEAMVKALRL